MSYGEHESISQFPMPSFWQSSSVDHLNTATASVLCILVDLVGGASTPYFYVKYFMHAHLSTMYVHMSIHINIILNRQNAYCFGLPQWNSS